MTDSALANWGARYGVKLADVKKLSRFLDRYAKEREHYCNGDPHPSNLKRADKNANSQLWDRDSEITGRFLTHYIRVLGFDGIDFGVGLWPSLSKGSETCIMVPDLDGGD